MKKLILIILIILYRYENDIYNFLNAIFHRLKKIFNDKN